MARTSSSSRRALRTLLVAAIVALSVAIASPASAQTRYASGQDVVPVFEGWEHNADGSFNMVFGYMNRNYEQEIDLPVGADNTLEPGLPDQGQPTHFYTRRQQFVFKVKVPKDFGKKDLIWTLKVEGKTEKAYASLLPFWELGNFVYMENRGSSADITDYPEPNVAPSIHIAGPAQVNTAVGATMPLVAEVTDDGHPSPRRRPGAAGATAAATPTGATAPPAAAQPAAPPAAPVPPVPVVRRDSDGGIITATGTPGPGGSGPRRENPLTQAVVRLDPGVSLGVTWVVYRGSTTGVTFTRQRTAVVNGKAESSVQFTEPGSYTLRAYADDGILLGAADVAVTVARAK